MSSYNITKNQYSNAKKIGVTIKPSTNKNKKIDVFNKDGKKLFAIGDINYKDFDLYKKEKGLEYAKSRKLLYKIRHNKHRKKVGTRSYFSDQILWS